MQKKLVVELLREAQTPSGNVMIQNITRNIFIDIPEREDIIPVDTFDINYIVDTDNDSCEIKDLDNLNVLAVFKWSQVSAIYWGS